MLLNRWSRKNYLGPFKKTMPKTRSPKKQSKTSKRFNALLHVAERARNSNPLEALLQVSHKLREYEKLKETLHTLKHSKRTTYDTLLRLEAKQKRIPVPRTEAAQDLLVMRRLKTLRKRQLESNYVRRSKAKS